MVNKLIVTHNAGFFSCCVMISVSYQVCSYYFHYCFYDLIVLILFVIIRLILLRCIILLCLFCRLPILLVCKCYSSSYSFLYFASVFILFFLAAVFVLLYSFFCVCCSYLSSYFYIQFCKRISMLQIYSIRNSLMIYNQKFKKMTFCMK